MITKTVKKYGVKALSLAVLAGITLGCGDTVELPNRQYQLVWEDEFNGTTGDLPDTVNNWTFETGTGENGWGNNELQYYTNRTENASLDGLGNLVITAIEESFEGSAYTSARLITKDKHEFTYGRFEARLITPFSQGLWPAFWMLGADIDTNPWPGAGEIDVMELRGQEPSVMAGTIHGPGYSGGESITQDFVLADGRFDTDYHVFAVEWGPDYIDFFVDDILYQTITPSDLPIEQEDGSFCDPEEDSSCDPDPANENWVFNKNFFLLLNVAVGGSYVGNPNENSRFPQTMTVDYVRVYEQIQ